MEKMKIYTHGYKAHIDEVLACAILVAYYMPEEFMIYRLDKESDIPKELQENEFVVDFGGEYDDESRFDHHQEDPEVVGQCAASLVAKRYMPRLLSDKMWGVAIRRITMQDNGGIDAIRGYYGFDPSPFTIMEWIITKKFETDPVMVVAIVADAIQDRTKFMEKIIRAKRWLKENAEIKEICGVNVLLKDRLSDDIDTVAIYAAEHELIKKEYIQLCYGPDDRNPDNMVLFRTTYGANTIDLCKCTPKNLVFMHKNGFLLKFKDEPDMTKLIRQAVEGE